MLLAIKFHMFFNHSFSFIPNVIHEVDEAERFIRRNDAWNESSYITARESREIPKQKAGNMEKWTYSLEERYGTDAHSVNEDTYAENGEWGLPQERAQTTEYLTRDFGSSWKLQDIIAAEMRSLYPSVMLLWWRGYGRKR